MDELEKLKIAVTAQSMAIVDLARIISNLVKGSSADRDDIAKANEHLSSMVSATHILLGTMPDE